MFADFDIGLIIFLAVVGAAVLLFELGLLRSVYSEEEQKKRQLKKRLADVRSTLRSQTDAEILRKDLNPNDTSYAKFILLIPGANYISGLIDRGAEKRLDKFDEQLPEAIDIIIRALRAGHPFDGALKVVSEELPNPVAEEFSVTSAEINYGVSVSNALNGMVSRVPSKQLRSFVTAVLVQKETGGNLAEILENISSVIRGGFKFQRKLKTLAAEGKMSIAVLAGMPIVLGFGMYLLNPELVLELFTNPKGKELLYGVTVLFIIGFFWAKKIVKIEV
jgi:Flp pilus assembly protein TadB